MKALQVKKEKVLEKLIKKYLSDHDLLKTDTDGESPLHIACFGECTDEKLSVIRILVENGLNPHTLNCKGEKPQSSLHHKKDKRMILLQQACRQIVTPNLFPNSLVKSSKESQRNPKVEPKPETRVTKKV